MFTVNTVKFQRPCITLVQIAPLKFPSYLKLTAVNRNPTEQLVRRNLFIIIPTLIHNNSNINSSMFWRIFFLLWRFFYCLWMWDNDKNGWIHANLALLSKLLNWSAWSIDKIWNNGRKATFARLAFPLHDTTCRWHYYKTADIAFLTSSSFS